MKTSFNRLQQNSKNHRKAKLVRIWYIPKNGYNLPLQLPVEQHLRTLQRITANRIHPSCLRRRLRCQVGLLQRAKALMNRAFTQCRGPQDASPRPKPPTKAYRTLKLGTAAASVGRRGNSPLGETRRKVTFHLSHHSANRQPLSAPMGYRPFSRISWMGRILHLCSTLAI